MEKSTIGIIIGGAAVAAALVAAGCLFKKRSDEIKKEIDETKIFINSAENLAQQVVDELVKQSKEIDDSVEHS